MERDVKSSPCIDCPEYQAALREIERLRKENHTLRQTLADKARAAMEPKP